MEYQVPHGMWETIDGTDCSKLTHLDWQKTGFRMQPNIEDHVRGVDSTNDTGYIPESDSKVKQWVNKSISDGMVDPSMVEIRSEDLRGHRGEFWKEKNEEEEAPEKPEKKLRLKLNIKMMRRWAIGLVTAAALLCFARYYLFNIYYIEVIGVSGTEMAKVRQSAGIHKGDNILTINDDAVEKAVNGLSFVQFDALRKSFQKVSIYVTKRERVSYLWHCGIIYTLDSRGIVLDECNQEGVIPDYPQIEGLDIKYCQAGSRIILNNDKQLQVYRTFARELTVMGLNDVIHDIYLTDPDSIYLGTDGGFSVRMGDAGRIHAKLRALMLVLDYLQQKGAPVGTIDVSTPESPTYIPTSAL